jgi:hypothetical protein
MENPVRILNPNTSYRTHDEINDCRCDYCGETFQRPSQYGRKPRYCRPSHRVRACERRRGLLRARERPIRPLPKEPGFSQRHFIGRSHIRRFAGRPSELHTTHRLRPYAMPDEYGLVPSLCGQPMRFPSTPIQPWVPDKSSCNTCEALAALHPIAGQWWSAATQLIAFALMDEIQSTALAIRQAAAGSRPTTDTLTRIDHRLSRLLHGFGLTPPEPSLHPASCRT